MQVIKTFLRPYLNNEPAAIGVSGGADSLALVLMLKETFPQLKFVALTVDHGLRSTSRQEAEYVAEVMHQYHIEHHILTWKGEKPVTAIEEKARIARYDLLCGWCKRNNIPNLIIAHHLYDQAETFLMRLQRGSGVYGLSGIDAVSFRNGIRILRPLLKTKPEILKNYLQTRKIDWIEDESNTCDNFLRVKMRQFLPVLEKQTGISAERLCMAADNLRRTRCFIEDTANDIIKKHIHCWNAIAYSFDYSIFLSWHTELKFFILGELLKKLGRALYRPETENLIDLLNKMEDSQFENATLGGCYILKNELRIWIIQEERDKKLFYTNSDWNNYILENPEFRGIKVPHKLKLLLLNKK